MQANKTKILNLFSLQFFIRNGITYDLDRTALRMDEENTCHKLLDDILTFSEIIYQYVHLDQKPYIMKEIQKTLYLLNRSLIFTFNSYFHTCFTKFRPYLPQGVNVIRAQIHRINNIIYFVHRNVVISRSCHHLSAKFHIISVNTDLVAVIYTLKYFIAVQLSGAICK